MKEAAARALGQKIDNVEGFRKLAEGGFNRAFEITIEDGTKVIAKLPYASTAPKRLAVASEVATLDLVRSYGVAVPQVYGYDTNRSNSVGSEYIIMEKIGGNELGNE